MGLISKMNYNILFNHLQDTGYKVDDFFVKHIKMIKDEKELAKIADKLTSLLIGDFEKGFSAKGGDSFAKWNNNLSKLPKVIVDKIETKVVLTEDTYYRF